MGTAELLAAWSMYRRIAGIGDHLISGQIDYRDIVVLNALADHIVSQRDVLCTACVPLV